MFGCVVKWVVMMLDLVWLLVVISLVVVECSYCGVRLCLGFCVW